MNERELESAIRQLYPRAGDDAAVIGDRLITADMLIEDVDFTRDIPLALVARKAIAVNVSDIAAMGGTAEYAVVSLGIPRWAENDSKQLLEAMKTAGTLHDVEIVGGDLSRSAVLVIAVTMLGRATRVLLRSGARPGQRVYVSRPLGGAAAGLQLLSRGWSVDGRGDVTAPGGVSYAIRELGTSAVRAQVLPEPEAALGAVLASIPEVTSCIDISDGLSSDIHRLCAASKTGAEIDRDRIPVFPDLLSSAPALGLNVRNAVLNGGEDYALLFTSSLRESEMSARLGRPVYAIGRMTQEEGVRLKEGDLVAPLEPAGFDHFS